MLRDVKKAKNATSWATSLAQDADGCLEQTHNSSTPGGQSWPTAEHNSVSSISNCRSTHRPLARQPQKAAPDQLNNSFVSKCVKKFVAERRAMILLPIQTIAIHVNIF